VEAEPKPTAKHIRPRCSATTLQTRVHGHIGAPDSGTSRVSGLPIPGPGPGGVRSRVCSNGNGNRMYDQREYEREPSRSLSRKGYMEWSEWSEWSSASRAHSRSGSVSSLISSSRTSENDRKVLLNTAFLERNAKQCYLGMKQDLQGNRMEMQWGIRRKSRHYISNPAKGSPRRR